MPKRVQLLVDAIKKADTDVVVLQEFESEKYLMSNDHSVKTLFYQTVRKHGAYQKQSDSLELIADSFFAIAK